jgi:hypothetical protein
VDDAGRQQEVSHGFTEKQLRERGFSPDSSGSWSKDDIPTNHPEPPATVSKRDECQASLAEEESEGPRASSFRDGARYRVIITSYRTTLIDPSNASMKQLEDCLTPPQGTKKYGAGIIPDDSPKYCDQPLYIQHKVKKGLERTEIEVLEYNTTA